MKADRIIESAENSWQEAKQYWKDDKMREFESVTMNSLRKSLGDLKKESATLRDAAEIALKSINRF
jgi:hypothetical protein